MSKALIYILHTGEEKPHYLLQNRRAKHPRFITPSYQMNQIQVGHAFKQHAQLKRGLQTTPTQLHQKIPFKQHRQIK